jgi:hypothetical protein
LKIAVAVDSAHDGALAAGARYVVALDPTRQVLIKTVLY